MPDYIPQSDADFSLWMSNYVTKLNSMQAALGLSATNMSDLTTLQSKYESSLTNVNKVRATFAAATRDKDAAREALVVSVRSLTRTLQANPEVTDAQRADLQISVTDETRTASPVPDTRPIAVIDTRQSQRHTISFMDEATPTRKAKPEGVYGCEIRATVGGAEPADPDEMKFVAIDTKTPYVAEFDGADAGKTVYYRLRWVNTRQEPGPWSDIYSATITK